MRFALRTYFPSLNNCWINSRLILAGVLVLAISAPIAAYSQPIIVGSDASKRPKKLSRTASVNANIKNADAHHDALTPARANYIYRAKAKDTPEAIAFEFLAQAHEPAVKQQFFAHNQIAKHAALKPVAENTPFSIPVAWMYLKPSKARVLSTHGSVQTASTNTEQLSAYQTITSNMLLAEGTRVKTGADSFATIALPDGSLLSVEPNSDLLLGTLKQYASSDIFKINIALAKGRVESTVKPLTSPESSYTVKSKRLTTGVRGTRFAVSDNADDSGYALIEVLDGDVAVNSPKNGSLSTPKGYGRVAQNNEPSGLIDLFSKPTWTCTPASNIKLGTDLSLETPDKTVELKLDVYADKQTSVQSLTPIKQLITSIQKTNLELGLPLGVYTIVARAVDQYGLQGNASIQTIAVSPPVQAVIKPTAPSQKQATWILNEQTLSWVWLDDPIVSTAAIAEPAASRINTTMRTACAS